MSVQAMEWVWRNSQHKGGELLVLLALANHAGSDQWECWPSIGLLAAESRLTRRQVQRIVRSLEASREVATVVAGGPGGATLYRIRQELRLQGVTRMPRRKDVAPAAPMSGGGDMPVPTGGRHGLRPNRKEPSDEPKPIARTSSRDVDEAFEALATACRIDIGELTDSSRGSLNRALSQIRKASPESNGDLAQEITSRARRWPYQVPVTPNGLAKHWPSLAGPRPQTAVRRTTREFLQEEGFDVG